MPPGQFPYNSVYVICRHQRVHLNRKCTGELHERMRRLKISKSDGSITFKFDKYKTIRAVADQVRVGRRVTVRDYERIFFRNYLY